MMSALKKITQAWLMVPPKGSSWREVLRPATRQTIRVLVSIVTAWVVGMTLHLQETIWALVTALIVTQSSITQTMATARDQITGTLLGAVAGIVAVLLEMWTGLRWLPFWIVLAPLAFLAAVQTNLRFACITLIIVYLFPSEGSPFLPMVTRLTAIMIGVVVSLVVSFVVLHSSARKQAFHTSSRILRRLDGLLEGALDQKTGWREIETRNEACVALLIELEGAVEEARRERFSDLEKRDPVLAALPRLMRRLLNDTMLVARAIATGRAAGNTGLVPLYKSLSHTLRALAHSCEQRFVHKQDRHPHQPEDKDILELLPRLEEQTRPEMRFVMSLFKDDLERAVGVLMRDDASSAKGL
ncbi:FUSC family protein [Gluconobacter cerinus]|uniref:FUSC family protein n=1 Tax=Gluconobacter cerinus TaxID=38307 RepID=UPI001FFD7F6E|nr:FUSC family protein [Gluconobacter cerinus]